MDSPPSWSSPRGRKVLHPATQRSRGCAVRPPEFSASIMMKNSIRPRTCNMSLERGPWLGFNWRTTADWSQARCPSPAGPNTPVDLSDLTADQQLGRLTCNGVHATPFVALQNPLSGNAVHSTLVSIPAPGTETTTRIAHGSLPVTCSISRLAMTTLSRRQYKWTHNSQSYLTNQSRALQLSFNLQRTHYVTLRTLTAQ